MERRNEYSLTGPKTAVSTNSSSNDWGWADRAFETVETLTNSQVWSLMTVEMASNLMEKERASGTPEEVTNMKLVLEAALRFGAWPLKNETAMNGAIPSGSFEKFLTWIPGPVSKLSCTECDCGDVTFRTRCGHHVCMECIQEIASLTCCLVCCPSCSAILFAFAPGENLLVASRMAKFAGSVKIIDQSGLNALCVIGILVARFPAVRSFVGLVLSKMFELKPAPKPGGLTIRMVEFVPSPGCFGAPECSEKCTCNAQAQEKLAEHIFVERQHRLFSCRDFWNEGLLLIGQHLNAAPFPESLGGVFEFFHEMRENSAIEGALLCKFAKTANEGIDRPILNGTVKIVTSALGIVVFPGISGKLLAFVSFFRAILSAGIVIFKIILRSLFDASFGTIMVRVTVAWLVMVYYFRSMFSMVFGANTVMIMTFMAIAWPALFIIKRLRQTGA